MSEFKDYAKAERFITEQVFNCDEREHSLHKRKRHSGHKPMKDTLTLLLCGNASGDSIVKPLLVYHSETHSV